MKLLIFSTLLATFASLAASEFVVRENGLQVDVYHLPPAPVVYQNSTDLTFSPTTFTLIHGQHDAILIDAPATDAQGHALAAWIAATIPGKRLAAIYITHGHGDHFFTAPLIQQHFPGAAILATRDVYAHMQDQYAPALFNGFWNNLFPGQISSRPFPVTLLPPCGTFSLEGPPRGAVQVGPGATYHATVLHVPALGLVVGGDVIYGDCFQLLAEDTTPALRAQWKRSLDRVAALQPRVVIPSHAQPGNGYAPGHVADSKRYVEAWGELLPRAKTWQALEESVRKRFPGRVGSFILRWSCQVPFGADF